MSKHEQTWATDMSTGSVEAMGTKSCKIAWENFDPVEPEEVSMVLVTVRLDTSVLDLCSSWGMAKNVIRLLRQLTTLILT